MKRADTVQNLRTAVMRATAALPVSRLVDSADPTVPMRRVVVVTGPHRSGTTVMGRLLNHGGRTFVVKEPFNLDWGLQGVPRRYPYMTGDDTDSTQARILRRFLSTGEGVWMGHGRPLPATHARPTTLRRQVRGMRPWGRTAIVKDPFLLLALGWINRGLSDRPVVVTLRHPCGWVSSLLRRQMHPRAALQAFREQEAFGDPVVARILDGADWENESVVASGAATWACLVRMLDVQLAAGANAVVVRMEDFARDPRAVMVDVYARTRIVPPGNLGDVLHRYTGDHNVVTPEGRVLHEFRRNSAALATAWRTRLPSLEQKQVREIAEEHAVRWYDGRTW